MQVCSRNDVRVDLDPRDLGDTSRHWQLQAGPARSGLRRIQSVLRASSRPTCASLLSAPARCASTAVTLGAAATEFTAWKIDCRRGNNDCTAHMPARGKCPKRYLGYSTSCDPKFSFLGLFALDERGAITRFNGLLPERVPPPPPRSPPPPRRSPPPLKAPPPPTRWPPPPKKVVAPPPPQEFRPVLPLAFSTPRTNFLDSSGSKIHLVLDSEGTPWVALAEPQTGFNPVVLKHNPAAQSWVSVGGTLPLAFEASVVRLFFTPRNEPILAIASVSQRLFGVWLLSQQTAGSWTLGAPLYGPPDAEWDVLPAMERGTDVLEKTSVLAAMNVKNEAGVSGVAIYGVYPDLDRESSFGSWFEYTDTERFGGRVTNTQKGPIALVQPRDSQDFAQVALTSTSAKRGCLALWSLNSELDKWVPQGNWNGGQLVCGAEGGAIDASATPTLIVAPYRRDAPEQYVAYRGVDGSVRVSMWNGTKGGSGGQWSALGKGPVTRPTTSKEAPGLVLDSLDRLYVSTVVTSVDDNGAEVSEGVDVYRYQLPKGVWLQLNTPQQLWARSSARLAVNAVGAPVHVAFDDAGSDSKASVWQFM